MTARQHRWEPLEADEAGFKCSCCNGKRDVLRCAACGVYGCATCREDGEAATAGDCGFDLPHEWAAGRCRWCGARDTWPIASEPCPMVNIAPRARTGQRRERYAAAARARAHRSWERRRRGGAIGGDS